MGELILVTHGETDNDKAGNLSSGGRFQALVLAEQLCSREIGIVYTSPLRRCVQTAEPIGERLRCKVEIREDLLGADGGSLGQKRGAYSEFRWVTGGEYSGQVGAESLISVQRRLVGLVYGVFALQPTGVVVMVTHTLCVRLMVCWFCGMALEMQLRLRVDPGSLSELKIFEDSAMLQSLNCHFEVLVARESGG